MAGGMNPLSALSGAPQRPGTMYTAKLKLATAKNKRGTDTNGKSLSCANFNLPSK